MVDYSETDVSTGYVSVAVPNAFTNEEMLSRIADFDAKRNKHPDDNSDSLRVYVWMYFPGGMLTMYRPIEQWPEYRNMGYSAFAIMWRFELTESMCLSHTFDFNNDRSGLVLYYEIEELNNTEFSPCPEWLWTVENDEGVGTLNQVVSYRYRQMVTNIQIMMATRVFKNWLKDLMRYMGK